MNTVNNIPEKHLHKTSRENNCETVKIIKAVTKINILFINHIFIEEYILMCKSFVKPFTFFVKS